MPSATNKTKVTFFRGQDAAAGGFVNVASLMNDVVTKMVANGFKVVYATTDSTTANTVAWGVLTSSGGALSWAAGSVPAVGSPVPGSTYKISTGPTASITLEASGPATGGATQGWVDYLNPTTAWVASTVTQPKEAWRVKFELLSTECVSAYVGSPLQLPAYYGVGSTLTADSWGLPGTHSKLTDSSGLAVDAAGAVGSKQSITTYLQITAVTLGSGGSGYNVGDYITESGYAGSSTFSSTGGLQFITGSNPGIPVAARSKAIFKVETVSSGAVTSVSIVDGGRYPPGTQAGTGTSSTAFRTGAGVGCTLSITLTTGAAGVDESDSYQGLYNRGTRVGAQGASYPLTYELAIANSGFFIGIYESNWATQVGGANSSSASGRFNWMVVQRPVDRDTGTILDNYESTTSKHPIFCINGVGGRYYQFVVREKDIAHPTAGPADHSAIKYYDAAGTTSGTLVSQYVSSDYTRYTYRVPAVLNSEDSHLLFNPENQISLTEDKKYLITFPHNLSTPRFRYTEELDLIGLTSADVLMTGQSISITTYSESTPRTYLALPPSGQYNTGLRVCVVKSTGNGSF